MFSFVTRRGLFLAIAIIGMTSVVSRASGQLMRGHEIDDQRRATFRVSAPDASEVKVISLTDEGAMGAQEYTLTKGNRGEWTVTTQPCRPGFHYYELMIDGARVADPRSPMYFGWGKWTSGLEVPEEGPSFYQPSDVPHGEIRVHWYHSQVTGRLRKCLVYVPPGYESSGLQYPVLYLQHGAGESELGWTMQGRANFILDNLIAAGKAQPMLIVMDNGYAARSGAENPWRPSGEDNAFAELVLQELIPAIEQSFRTPADRKHRAIAGLSMGAGQALSIGLGNPDKFVAVGAFSGGGRRFDMDQSYGGIFRDAEAFQRRGMLLWIGCGELDRGYPGLKAMHGALQQQGIEHVWYSGPGSHEWQVWRRHLYEFAQQIFQ